MNTLPQLIQTGIYFLFTPFTYYGIVLINEYHVDPMPRSRKIFKVGGMGPIII